MKNIAIPNDVHHRIKNKAAQAGINLGQYVSDILDIAAKSKIVVPEKTTGIRIKLVEQEKK